MASIDAGAVLVEVQTTEDRAEEAADVLRRLGVLDLHRISRRDRQVY